MARTMPRFPRAAGKTALIALALLARWAPALAQGQLGTVPTTFNASCSQNWASGAVLWNFPDPWASGGYSVVEEDTFRRVVASGGGQSGIEGVYNSDWGCGVALKVPGSCVAIVRGSRQSDVSCCCSIDLAAPAGCLFINPTAVDPMHWPSCPPLPAVRPPDRRPAGVEPRRLSRERRRNVDTGAGPWGDCNDDLDLSSVKRRLPVSKVRPFRPMSGPAGRRRSSSFARASGSRSPRRPSASASGSCCRPTGASREAGGTPTEGAGRRVEGIGTR